MEEKWSRRMLIELGFHEVIQNQLVLEGSRYILWKSGHSFTANSLKLSSRLVVDSPLLHVSCSIIQAP